jgi:hypothetical protein
MTFIAWLGAYSRAQATRQQTHKDSFMSALSGLDTDPDMGAAKRWRIRDNT